ncbi:NAD(P)/FAD-dependent oxidoreductase [Subtercola sp. PAMC28395]|nr:NAD(P)/FAD-dependent oxidoreductase [Subtercola sp. PAMC28395]
MGSDGAAGADRADYDLIVVGGGPVGLAAAIGARQRGLSVVVVEPRSLPLDKACGEGLMPGAMAELSRLGVEVDGHTITGIAYRQGSGPRFATHDFEAAPGRGVRRPELSGALAQRAISCGASFVDAKVAALVQDARGVTVSLSGGPGIRGLWLFGCDGLHSPVRRMAGLEAVPTRRLVPARRRYGLRRHFRVAPWSDRVEVFWARECEVYVTPVSASTIGVAILGGRGLDFERVIASIPALAARLEGAEPDSALQGAGPLRQRVKRHGIGRVLLVGDASGYVDALTGEGLRVGLAQAAGAVAAVAGAHEPVEVNRNYERAWSRASRDANTLTAGLLALAHSPFRRLVVPISAALPAVFGAAVERIAR